MFRYVLFIVFLSFLSMCSSMEIEPEENRHKLSGFTTPEDRESLDERLAQKMCNTKINMIEQHVLRNDITALIDLYRQVSEDPNRWFSENMQRTECMSDRFLKRSHMLRFKTEQKIDQNVALLFYPDRYVKQYYGRSFDGLNEAAKFCILIAARCGHQISCEMIASGFPFQERDRVQQQRLRFNGRLSVVDRLEYILQTPFSLNYGANIVGFNSEEGAVYLSKILENIREYDPIVIMNAAYVKFSQGHFDDAYHLFMTAAEKGIVAGYIEATGIILRSKNTPDI